MKLFDFLKKSKPKTETNYESSIYEEPPIPEEEKKYYQHDSYYTNTVPVAAVDMNGNYLRQKVLTFNERKKTSFPSQRGLYVAEILLLHYCSYGTYPHPQNGYPGFWWFQYGIRNVGYRLETLRERGFIRVATAKESIKKLTVAELKELLKELNLKVTGKKEELINRIIENASNDFLEAKIITRKYVLTQLGELELKENEYVPYMHKTSEKTTDDTTYGSIFTVWELNRRIKGGDTTHWLQILENIKEERYRDLEKRKIHREEIIKKLKLSPETAAIAEQLENQDAQLKSIQNAENLYKQNNNINALISFWENIWNNGGLLFNGSHWTFRLPDLYIKQKRYDDALRILKKIKNPEYEDKKESYTQKIKKLINIT